MTNQPIEEKWKIQKESIEWKEALDSFIKKWVPGSYAHLSDNDENDGERLRTAIQDAITTAVAKRDEFYQKNEERRLERYEALGWHKGKMAERKRIVEMIEKMVGFTDGVESHSFIDKDKILKIIKH